MKTAAAPAIISGKDWKKPGLFLFDVTEGTYL
jgi:hypothetical protein